MTEVELKFAVADFGQVTERLRKLGCEPGETLDEGNLVFDTPDGVLRKREILLRLRNVSGRTLLTVKEPGGSSAMKVRNELETVLCCSIDQGREMLEILGYRVTATYSKKRSTCRLGDVTVCLDRLWFGCFVEIEADSEESLTAVAVSLGFDIADGIAKSYLKLESQSGQKSRK